MSTYITRREALKLAGSAAVGLAAAGGLANVQAAEHPSGDRPSAEHPVAKQPHAEAGKLTGAYGGDEYTLPQLPYAYDALEPHYSAKALEIHHTRHHAGYVRGLNKALAALSAARTASDYSSIKKLSRNLAFHGSGHVLHSLFWHSMTPGGAEVPDTLAAALKRDFGSVQAAKAQFAAASKKVEASGWGMLAYEPIGDKLMILQAEKHQNLAVWGVVPLLVCDVWEHAYYLQYANKRGGWVDSFMKLANWQFAAERYEAAIR